MEGKRTYCWLSVMAFPMPRRCERSKAAATKNAARKYGVPAAISFGAFFVVQKRSGVPITGLTAPVKLLRELAAPKRIP